MNALTLSKTKILFSIGTETSDVSSTKLVAYESVTFTSLALTAQTEKITANAKNTVSNICLFKIIYLHNNFINYS